MMRTAGMNSHDTRWSAGPPLEERADVNLDRQFGSAHPGGWNGAMADGLMRSLNYSIDLEVFNAVGSRAALQ